MKRLKFLETKRTPRYSLRKLNVGMASVLLGVTIFGINLTNHSVKAATTENVGNFNISANSNSQRTSAAVLTTAGQTKTQETTSTTEKVQQNSTSNDVTANNSTEAAPTSQSAPNKQGSADTDIKSSTARLAARLALTNLVAFPAADGNAAGTASTAGQNDTNPQPANENNELANKSNLTSSDNYSSNIYKGKDGKYYKIVTIYGTDYVYHVADIQASGANWRGVPKQSAEDTKNNINISKEDLGNGQTRWTVVFFPNKGLQNVGSKLSGLCNATFGIAITSDYQIVGKVNMEVISDSTQSFVAHTFKPGSSSATDITIQNPTPEVKFSFDPTTDVEPNGLIRSLAYNNQYLQGPYYFTTATDTGKENLWQTYFKDGTEYNNAYDGNPYLGSNHDFHFNTFKIANETGVDGAKYGDSIIYDTQGGVNGVFSSDNFNQAMEFKSQGTTGNGKTQFSSYVISFITQHTDSHEVGLIKSPTGQQFSGISANIYSYQNLGYYNMMSSLYGEQKVLNVSAKDIIPNWDEAKAANQAIDTALVNKKGEINTATNIDQATKDNLIKEATDAADVAKNAIAEATTVDAIKKAQEDGVTNIYNVKVPSLEDAKQAANQLVDEAVSKKLDEIKANTNLTDEEKTKLTNDANSAANDAKDKIKSATTNDVATQAGKDGVAAIEAVTVPADSGVKKNAKQAIDDALNNKKSEINGATNIDQPTKDNLIKEATDAATKAKDAIDKATTNNDVATEQTKGTNAIDAVKVPSLTDSQTAAKQAIDQAAKTRDNAIDASNLTAEEKDTLKQTVADEVNKAKAAIDAATKDADVKTAQTNGEKAINAVEIPTSSKTKNDANSDLDNTADAAKQAIDETSGLTDDQKQTAKDQIDKAVDDAKENIKNASDNKGVADATDAGKLAIDKVSAKAAIDAAVAAKKSEIAQAPLTAEEAKPLNNLVDQDADAAKAAIAAATTSAAVETAKNNGVETINNIKVPTTSATKDDANKATDAGNITPTVPGGKVTVKDPSHLTDSEKDQVKKNVEDANKDNFPDGTEITVGDDGTATVTYPDGSKDVIAGTDLIIAAKGEDVLGSKYHSHKNGSNSSQADRVKGASTANGSIANAGNNLGVKAESDNAFVGVKGESDNAIGNNKATSLKTLPQTGTKDTSILGVLGMLLASLGLFGFKKKRDEK